MIEHRILFSSDTLIVDCFRSGKDKWLKIRKLKFPEPNEPPEVHIISLGWQAEDELFNFMELTKEEAEQCQRASLKTS